MSDVNTEFVSMSELMGLTDPSLAEEDKKEIAKKQQELITQDEFKPPIEFEEGTEKVEEEQSETDDFNFARSNLHSLMEKSQELLEISLNEARTSPHPMNIKTAGDTVKMMKDLAQSIMDVHNQKADISLKKKGKNPKGVGMEPQTVNTTNITQVVVEGNGGTTSDMLKRARQRMLEAEENIVDVEVQEVNDEPRNE